MSLFSTNRLCCHQILGSHTWLEISLLNPWLRVIATVISKVISALKSLTEVIQEIFVVQILVYCVWWWDSMRGYQRSVLHKRSYLPNFLTIHHQRLYFWPGMYLLVITSKQKHFCRSYDKQHWTRLSILGKPHHSFWPLPTGNACQLLMACIYR